jgi:DNA-binding transcriptional ArsR family regulator
VVGLRKHDRATTGTEHIDSSLLGGTCACAFAEIFGVTQPTVSQHLKVLREAGLVRTRREGTQIYYSLDRAGVREVRNVLGKLAAGVRHRFAGVRGSTHA